MRPRSTFSVLDPQRGFEGNHQAKHHATLALVESSRRCDKLDVNGRLGTDVGSGVMERVTYPPAGACIYCGVTNCELTLEHILAFSLGGRFELPEASCKTCQRATSAYEFHLARKSYYAARSQFEVQSKRRRKMPETAPVELIYNKYGFPRETVSVSIKNAPLLIIMPTFQMCDHSGGTLVSKNVMKAIHLPNKVTFDQRSNVIGIRRRAHKVSVLSGEIDPEIFARVLWKIASGFFWLTSIQSLSASPAGKYATGRIPIVFGTHPLRFQDIYSIDPDARRSVEPKVLVFSMNKDDHRYLYCQISFFSMLEFPNYICRIPNVDAVPIQAEFP